MPAPSPIDMKAPLARRKALITKLMSQMARVSTTPGFAVAAPVMRGPMASNERGAQGLVQTQRPAGIEPVLGEIHGQGMPQAPQAPQGPPGQPEAPGPPMAPGPPVAPEAWQQSGAHSAEAYNSFMGLSEADQQRIMANPVARRRFFA